MKLLLTSNGLSNPSITDALFDLVGKKPADTIITFIPTASHTTNNDKGWLVNNLSNINKQGLKKFTITDIAVLEKEEILKRFEEADVLFWGGGGGVDYLLSCIDELGIQEHLPDLLQTRVWAGISAGSMVTNPTTGLSSRDLEMYYQDGAEYMKKPALNFVDLYIRPHYLSGSFSKITIENFEPIAKEIDQPIYMLDDMSAVKVDGDTVEVISEGEYYIFNEK